MPSGHQTPRIDSDLMWDFFAINTYLLGSLIYLYLPLIPDLALVRGRSQGLRRRIYGLLSIGWQGSQLQWARLEMPAFRKNPKEEYENEDSEGFDDVGGARNFTRRAAALIYICFNPG